MSAIKQNKLKRLGGAWTKFMSNHHSAFPKGHILFKIKLNSITTKDLTGKVITMEIRGKIIELLPEKAGQSANGGWRKQEYVLETDGQYPKKICFMAWGDKIDQFNIKQGETVEVSVDLESREYNGRWYTDVKAWKVSKYGDNAYRENTYDNRDDYDKQHGNVASIDDDVIPF